MATTPPSLATLLAYPQTMRSAIEGGPQVVPSGHQDIEDDSRLFSCEAVSPPFEIDSKGHIITAY